MSTLKRVVGLSGLTAFLGALAFAVPANATVKADCVVNGDAKAETTKPVAKKYVMAFGGKGTFTFDGLPIVCIDLLPGKGEPVPVHTGIVDASGTFRNSMQIPGTDQWINTQCGHGKVMGRINSQTLGPKFNGILGRKFAVEFGPPYGDPTDGAFFWHHPGPANKVIPKPPSIPKINPDGGDPDFPFKGNPTGTTKVYRYGGKIQLSPSQAPEKDPVSELAKLQGEPPPAPDPDPLRGLLGGKCTKGFNVNGSVIVHEA